MNIILERNHLGYYISLSLLLYQINRNYFNITEMLGNIFSALSCFGGSYLMYYIIHYLENKRPGFKTVLDCQHVQLLRYWIMESMAAYIYAIYNVRISGNIFDVVMDCRVWMVPNYCPIWPSPIGLPFFPNSTDFLSTHRSRDPR